VNIMAPPRGKCTRPKKPWILREKGIRVGSVSGRTMGWVRAAKGSIAGEKDKQRGNSVTVVARVSFPPSG